jgi:hypothetical protein
VFYNETLATFQCVVVSNNFFPNAITVAQNYDVQGKVSIKPKILIMKLSLKMKKNIILLESLIFDT